MAWRVHACSGECVHCVRAVGADEACSSGVVVEVGLGERRRVAVRVDRAAHHLFHTWTWWACREMRARLLAW
jgi:hypothetical protein